MRLPLALTTLSFLFHLSHSLVYAGTDPIPLTATVSATIPLASPSTSDIQAPSLPILISPPDGTYTNDSSPEFTWRDSQDSNSNVIYYALYLNDLATYLGVSNLGNSASSTYTARLSGGHIILQPLHSLQDGSYNWKVVASDISGNQASSTSWSFTIDSTPPVIHVTNIDHYSGLELSSAHKELFTTDPFQVDGPKDVYFTILSEPWSTLTLKIYNLDNELIYQGSWPVTQNGKAYPHTYLEPGRYHLDISSFDRGGNTETLPDIYLNINEAVITLPLPDVPGLPPSIRFPYKPYSVPSLPATISNVESSLDLSLVSSILLTIIPALLLLLVWKRKYNLYLLDRHGKALADIKIYHSIPTQKSQYSPILVTHFSPIFYYLNANDHGKIFIKNLTRYSTLTIKTSNLTYVLSLCAKRKLYTLVIDP